jgi:hypothetical protein
MMMSNQFDLASSPPAQANSTKYHDVAAGEEPTPPAAFEFRTESLARFFSRGECPGKLPPSAADLAFELREEIDSFNSLAMNSTGSRA